MDDVVESYEFNQEELSSAVYEQIDQIIRNNTELSESQIERCRQRFREIYESFCLDKSQYEAEDQAVKDIAITRKTFPVAIRNIFTDIVNQENIALKTTTIDAGAPKPWPEIRLNVDTDIIEKLPEMKNTLSSIVEDASSSRIKAESLIEAINIENTNKTVQTHISECSSPMRKRQKIQGKNQVLQNNMDSQPVQTG